MSKTFSELFIKLICGSKSKNAKMYKDNSTFESKRSTLEYLMKDTFGDEKKILSYKYNDGEPFECTEDTVTFEIIQLSLTVTIEVSTTLISVYVSKNGEDKREFLFNLDRIDKDCFKSFLIVRLYDYYEKNYKANALD